MNLILDKVVQFIRQFEINPQIYKAKFYKIEQSIKDNMAKINYLSTPW